MLVETLLSFASPWELVAAAGLAVLAAGIVVVRRPSVPSLTLVAMGVGAAALAVAAGGITWNRAEPRQVAVMVDLSPSTRSAEYRDRMVLDRRIHELLRDVPYQLHYFAAQTTDEVAGGDRLPDLPAEQTTYMPPDAVAVLLFSDCRFALPGESPPTYIAVDQGLEDVEDAAVKDLEIRGNDVAVTVNNPGGTRRLTLRGVDEAQPTTVPTGATVVSRPIRHGASELSAELAPGDPWPENDALTAMVPPPPQYERWWVGRSDPPSGGDWRTFSPVQLPADAAAYLAPAVIVLDDVAASDLSDVQQQRLQQYVRDVGGGVVILGGAHAFAAGAYQGSLLDAICPLASSPPQPTNHWVLLLDASGSMSAGAGATGRSRWDYITGVIAALLPHLPPQDVVSAGSFADVLHWWTEGKPAHDLRAANLVPPGAYPHGPTNLQPALEAIAQSTDGRMPVQLLVLSDFDTQITGAADLAALLTSRHIHLHLLAIGEGSALATLRQVSRQSGGQAMTELDPARWAQSAQALLQAAGSDRMGHDAVNVTFEDEASGMAMESVSTWNHAWLKEAATRLARAPEGAELMTMAARWNVGEGRTLAAAFDPPPGQAQQFAAMIARPPHDPRYHISWQAGVRLGVMIDAIDNGRFLNDKRLLLELIGPASASSAQMVPQTAPGRYELEMPAPRLAALARVRASSAGIIGAAALAGRYAPEFEAIGNDHQAMEDLARRSGGEVVAPTRATPLDVHWPRHPIPLTSPLAILGGTFIAFGLVWWKRRT